ncbi:hypothetical protein Trco_008391 [Trichoderma cornu-damae]|uniref:Uncharacterized protein n=1 Tax=Trichoderma cornu-damae TaxID=654480 RepID=A0A9P8QFG4_9HYPO|nr:hypothetical protein Trco_008391 [Trichoderma cornu-damae]
MVVVALFGVDPDPDFPKNSPPRPSRFPSPSPSPTDIIAGAASSMASPASTDGGNGLLSVAEDGTSGDKILRGFLIGVAIGIALSLVLCCWLPCLRKGSPRMWLRRRNGHIRRRLGEPEVEASVSQNWPQRRSWDVGEDESHVSHDEVRSN